MTKVMTTKPTQLACASRNTKEKKKRYVAYKIDLVQMYGRTDIGDWQFMQSIQGNGVIVATTKEALKFKLSKWIDLMDDYEN